MTGTGNRRGLITGINVTPLVDVTLVLLVIMMVTASTIVAQAIPVELPKASSGESDPAPLAITLDRAGRIHVGAELVEEAALRERVRDARRERSELRAVLSADGALSHREVIHVVDVLRQEGISQFGISVAPDER